MMAAAALSLRGDRAARSAENDTTRLDPAQAAFFETRVQPILKARCFKCHGGEAKVRGNFRVDSRAAVLSGGDHGPAITLERPEAPRSRTGSTSRTFTPRCSPSSASINSLSYFHGGLHQKLVGVEGAEPIRQII